MLAVQVEQFSVQLAPWTEPPPVGGAPIVEQVQHSDPLKDPSTYPGGVVPGFTREDEEPQE